VTDEKLCPDCGRPGGFAQGECATYASCVAAARVECDTLTITRLRAENARLSEEVARLKAERQWIPVGERMPDMLQLVAAWCPDFVEPVAGIIRPHHSMTSKRVLDTSLGEGYGFEYFTHWAPLPEPPK